jgi:hypothetical protein
MTNFARNVIGLLSPLVVVLLLACSSESPPPTRLPVGASFTTSPANTPTPTPSTDTARISEVGPTVTPDTRSRFCQERRRRPDVEVCGYIAAGNYSLVGQDGMYLGQLVQPDTKSRYDSVCDMGIRISIESPLSPYGPLGDDFSAYKISAKSPPKIVDSSGNHVLYLSKKPMPRAKYDPDDLLDALGC